MRVAAGSLLLSAVLGVVQPAMARGVTPYLPLNLSPEIEREIDRVLLLAGRPIVRRPIAAVTVLDALPEACQLDSILCARVRKYLDAYMQRYGVTHVDVEAAVTEDSTRTLPNRRAMSEQDTWNVSVAGYYQLGDYLLLQLGGNAYSGSTVASGSWLSVGNEYAQLDVGFRDHWWSPMTDSAMLIGTQAETMPGVTLSNYTPISRFNVQYEIFVARMARVDDIAFKGRTTSGYPRLAGFHLSLEPMRGWSLSASRVLQFAGGERKRSAGDLFNALILPTRYDNISDSLSSDDQFGNQVASLTSKFLFPARQPFAIYFEYAGEDGSRAEGWRLGNVSLSAGIDIPRLWNRFDLTYEVSDWQNGWYVNGVYPQGTSNDGHPIGNWGADDRDVGDAVGAQSHSLRIGWAPSFGGLMEFRYRTLMNDDYSATDYQREHDFAARYSRAWNQFVFGAEIGVGRDVYGKDFSRAGAFVRYVPGQTDFAVGLTEPIPEAVAKRTEIFVDGGISASRLEYDPSTKGATPGRNVSDTGPHAGMGVRRAVSRRSDLGVRIEYDHVDGQPMIGVRAIDYRYRFGDKLALGVFAGATRYDAATAAYGYYGGIGVQWRNILSGVDLNLDVRGTDKIARDVLLPQDPPSVWGDVIYKIYSASAYLSYRFH
jgi:hypothetical protein